MKDLIVEIYANKGYLALCKSLAKRKDKWEELHSTFIAEVCEIKDDRIIKAKKGGYLDGYCINMILNLWGKRSMIKNQKRGGTSPLFDYSSTFEIPVLYNEEGGIDPAEFFSKPSDDYDITVDYISNEVKEFIEKECDSQDRDTMFRARIFKYSYLVYDNPDQFAKKVKIPRDTIRYNCNKFKQKLKDFLTK